jgi:predicted transposase YdaD
MARPRLPIDEELVRKLATIHCTDTEIAYAVNCSKSLLGKKRFSTIIEKGREEGKSRLRKLQWQSAQKGNVVMLIWLGKQLLQQSDKVEQKNQNLDVTADASKLSTETLKKIRDLMAGELSDKRPEPKHG